MNVSAPQLGSQTPWRLTEVREASHPDQRGNKPRYGQTLTGTMSHRHKNPANQIVLAPVSTGRNNYNKVCLIPASCFLLLCCRIFTYPWCFFPLFLLHSCLSPFIVLPSPLLSFLPARLLPFLFLLVCFSVFLCQVRISGQAVGPHSAPETQGK